MLHPLRGKIEQLEPPQFEIQDHTVPFLLGQTGMEGPRRDFPRVQTVHLILHQRDEGRNDQGQPGQQGCRQLVAERFPLTCRHNRHRVTAGKYRLDHLTLTGAECGKSELLAQLSAQIIHGENSGTGAVIQD